MTDTYFFIFAHQDDEFGCFFEIHQLANKGKKVLVFYLTSGSSDGKLNLQRNNESVSVLQKLGVKKNNIYFIGSNKKIPDGLLPEYLYSSYTSILNIIKIVGKPKEIYCHAYEGGHQDHDAAHFLSIKVAEKFNLVNRTFQFSLYTSSSNRIFFYRLFYPLRKNGSLIIKKIPCTLRLFFLGLCFYYKSQFKSWIGLFPFLVSHYIFNGTQILQPVSLKGLRRKPFKGKPLYQRRGYYLHHTFKLNISNFMRILS